MRRTRLSSILVPTVLAAALSLSACGDGASGWYHDEAQADCRARGLEAGSSAFEACVGEREDATYRYWMDRMRKWD